MSPLFELMKAIAKTKGAYGVQRVEKAADLVPNLEKMYQEQALQRVFGGDNAKALIVMPPERFEEFARPIDVRDPISREVVEKNVKKLQKLRQGFADVPFLEIGNKPGQLPFISGHEGRHRSRALEKRGEESSLINVLPKYREDFPRRTQEEFIEEMRRQLGESRLVTPEGKLRATPENPEGAIEFPEIFRNGGAVHMKDGSTENVTIEQMKRLLEQSKAKTAPTAEYNPLREVRLSQSEKNIRDYLEAMNEARQRVIGERVPTSVADAASKAAGLLSGAGGAAVGYGAQIPGIVGDVAGIYQMLKPSSWKDLPAGVQAMPTTEDIQDLLRERISGSPEFSAGLTGGNIAALGQGVAALPGLVKGVASRAKAVAQGLPQAVREAAMAAYGPATAPKAIVWHGSPHRFPATEKSPLGQFDPTKIGTGEGAQAYGHGHYLAESKDVAKSYWPRSPKYEEKLMRKYNVARAAERYPEMEVLEDAMLHNSPDDIVARFTNPEGGYSPEHAKAAKDFAKWYQKNPPEVGGLYKVDLPDEQIAKMLDWDKPLSEQHPDVQNSLRNAGINILPKPSAAMVKNPSMRQIVKEALKVDKPENVGLIVDNDFNLYKKTIDAAKKMGVNIDEENVGNFVEKNAADYLKALVEFNNQTGEKAYKGLMQDPTSMIDASETLKKAGIPGIKYLDQGSRGMGEGTSNFVVFPGGEDILNIVGREKKGGQVSADAMQMKAWDKQVQKKAAGGISKALLKGAKVLAGAGKSAEELAAIEKAAVPTNLRSKMEDILSSGQPPMTTPQGTGLPLLPRSQGMYTPGVAQEELPRQTGRGGKFTERMQDLISSRAAKRKTDELIRKGKELGMKEWYGTEPLRLAAMDLGVAPQDFERFMAHMASASQRNPVDFQNKMGSLLWYLENQGKLTPESVLLTNKLRKTGVPEGASPVEFPSGYGSLAQSAIFDRAKQIAAGDIEGALPPERKLGTFYRNLLGNLQPVTVDVNAVRGPVITHGDPRWLETQLVEKDELGNVIAKHRPREAVASGEMSLKEAKERPGFWLAAPEGSEYAGFEKLWQQAAKRAGVAPAEAQAMGWYGSADVTALKTKPELYVENLERLIRRTAEQTGKAPTEVLSDVLTGKGFLYKKGGKVAKKADGGLTSDDLILEERKL